MSNLNDIQHYSAALPLLYNSPPELYYCLSGFGSALKCYISEEQIHTSKLC